MSGNLSDRHLQAAGHPRPEVAVGAICVRHGRLLVVQRGRGAGRGLWAVPGGRLEPGESVEEGVLRELAEETGLAGAVRGLCGVVERRGPGYHYVILDYWVDAPWGSPVAGDDADDVRWVSAAELPTLPLVDGLVEFLAEHGVLHRLAGRP
jgi:8-oxo-dGTP diphosphatase